MKKFAALFFTSVFFILQAGAAYSEHSKILDEQSEYGGKIEETVYSPKDTKYRTSGIWKIVEFYDRSGRIAEIESYYTEEHAALDGVYKREQYYKNEPFEKGELTKAEFYYTEAHAKREGLRKSEIYYDDDRKTKAEFYYTDAYAKKKLIGKMVVEYDRNGKAVSQVYYDKNERLITTGTKTKKEWR